MKLSIKTTKLQEMLSKAIKGASNNKMIPITQMMKLELKNGTFTVVTTDATNYLYIREKNIEGEDFYVTVEVDTFSKLIARMNCETVTLELKNNSLEVVGNGTYHIALPLDENGALIKYPEPLLDLEGLSNLGTIKKDTVNAILNTVKPALAVTLEIPCYTGYYIGDRVVGTDTFKITSLNEQLFDAPKLLSPEIVNLLNVVTDEEINVLGKDNTIIFNTINCVVYGKVMTDIADYQIDAINNLLDSSFTSYCKVAKDALLQLLDRLSLFVGAYDKNGVYLTFTENGLQVSSKASNGIELIPYETSENFKSFTCCIDIEMLQSQVSAQTSDVVTIYYGEPNAIKMIDDKITQVIALLEDSRA